jgi:hypothetical protein
MLGLDEGDPKIGEIVDFFFNYDVHKSHGRSINRDRAREQGLKVANLEEIEGLTDLVRSLYNQYEIWFDKTPFYKMFENAHGIGWGRQAEQVTLQLPLTPAQGQPMPQPGPPQPSG